MKWTGDLVQANLINYTLSIPHFSGNQFVVAGQLAPDPSDTIFRGSQTSLISFSLLKSYFTWVNWDYFIYNMFSSEYSRTSTGYIVSTLPPSLGSVVDSTNYKLNDPQQQQLSVQFGLTQNPTIFRVEQVGKTQIYDFLAKVVALYGAVFGGVAVLMGVSENLIESIVDKVSNRKQKVTEAQTTETELILVKNTASQ